MTRTIKIGLLALAGSAIVLQTARAQGTWNQDDLILSVRATGGTGSSLNYEADLGSVLALSGSHTFSSTIANDLSSVFGANWLSRSDVYWSVSAVQFLTGGTDPRFTTYFTQPQGSSPPSFSSAGLATPAGHVNSQMGSLNGGFRSLDFTVGGNGVTTPNAGTVSSSLANSYSSQVVGATGNSYSAFPFGEANPNGILDFYRFAPNATALAGGSFDFNQNTGGFEFQAVPEPSTYGLIAGMGLLLLSFRTQLARRQS